MSNWSSVIVCWSGVDDEAMGVGEESLQDGSKEEARIALINEAIKKLREYQAPKEWTIAYSCGDKSTGSACEVVAVAHFNHFSPEWLLEALRSLPWGSPEQVEFMWKNEDMDAYERQRLLT